MPSTSLGAVRGSANGWIVTVRSAHLAMTNSNQDAARFCVFCAFLRPRFQLLCSKRSSHVASTRTPSANSSAGIPQFQPQRPRRIQRVSFRRRRGCLPSARPILDSSAPSRGACRPSSHRPNVRCRAPALGRRSSSPNPASVRTRLGASVGRM